MMEAGVILGSKGPIHWHVPQGRSGGWLPDSRDLWDVLWENRDTVTGFAHSHPGSGRPEPSSTDITTFAAIEAGLGTQLNWYIITSDNIACFRRISGGYERRWNANRLHRWMLAWVPWLREFSGYPGSKMNRKEKQVLWKRMKQG
jgi:hypothetical protein